MATIGKFYFLDAVSPNTGTMPSNSPAAISSIAVTGDATGASLARDTSSTPDVFNPDLDITVTSNATATQQTWGFRRFVSRPLAAQTFAPTDGNWTYSCANAQSSTLATYQSKGYAYLWRPSTGLQISTTLLGVGLAPPGTTETAQSATGAWDSTQAIIDGDIIVFDIWGQVTPTMSVAYTETFSYGGTTEASITTNAAFFAAPQPILLLEGLSSVTPVDHPEYYAASVI